MKARKKGNARRGREDQSHHWLGEGSQGQETLFLHFDPYVYCADRHLVAQVNRLARFTERCQELPRAILYQSDDSPMSWYIGQMADQYQLAVISEVYDEVVHRAVDYFQSKIITLDEVDEFAGDGAQLVMVPESCWHDERSFVESVRAGVDMLSQDGEAVFLLSVWGEENTYEVCWGDDTKVSLDEVVEGRLFRLSPAHSVKLFCLGELAKLPDLGSRQFVESHRNFFGRGLAQQFCLERLRESDVAPYLTSEDSAKRWVAVLSWKREEG